MVKDATGRELNIGGEIDLVIGFSPALVVTDVTFANASWGSQKQMIKMDKLSLLSKGARALSALVVGPLGLLAPFVSLGAYKAHPCSVHSIGK